MGWGALGADSRSDLTMEKMGNQRFTSKGRRAEGGGWEEADRLQNRLAGGGGCFN